MASASLPQSGGKKSLDAEINLVPFIDLLSMCICFLLITAVWVQLGAMQLKQSHGTDAAPQVKNDIELSLRLSAGQGWGLEAKQNGRVLKKANAVGPESLSQTVKLWREEFKSAPVASAMIHTKKEVSYGDMVGMMDVLRRQKITNLGVHPVKEGG
jgi:biopolymer transport protein TolR